MKCGFCLHKSTCARSQRPKLDLLYVPATIFWSCFCTATCATEQHLSFCPQYNICLHWSTVRSLVRTFNLRNSTAVNIQFVWQRFVQSSESLFCLTTPPLSHHKILHSPQDSVQNKSLPIKWNVILPVRFHLRPQRTNQHPPVSASDRNLYSIHRFQTDRMQLEAKFCQKGTRVCQRYGYFGQDVMFETWTSASPMRNKKQDPAAHRV